MQSVTIVSMLQIQFLSKSGRLTG